MRRQVVGVQIVRDHVGRDAAGNAPAASTASSIRVVASRGSRGRRCAGRGRRCRRRRCRRCSSAARRTASTGRVDGTAQRDRPRHVAARPAEARRPCPAITRATESSQRVSISRSCIRNDVGDPAEPRDGVGVVAARSARRTGCPTSSRAGRRPRRAAGGAAACTAASGRRARLRGATSRASARVRRGGATSTIGPLHATRAAAAPSAPSTASRVGVAEVRDHHRERLLVAVLARAQAARRVVRARRIAREVKAAEPLDARRSRRSASARPRAAIGSSTRDRLAGGRAQRRAAVRTPGTRSAARGTGDRAGPRTRAGTPGTSRTAPSSSSAGRRGCRSRS